MAGLILLALILAPLAEIAVFIWAGGHLGVAWTLALVLATAALGLVLLRRQGLQVLYQTQARLARDELPVGEMFDGVCLLAAGALLLTPGFLTDAIGFALFVPALRRALGYFVLRRVMARRGTRIWVNGREIDPASGQPQQQGRRPGVAPRKVIDADYTEIRRNGTTDSPWRK